MSWEESDTEMKVEYEGDDVATDLSSNRSNRSVTNSAMYSLSAAVYENGNGNEQPMNFANRSVDNPMEYAKAPPTPRAQVEMPLLVDKLMGKFRTQGVSNYSPTTPNRHYQYGQRSHVAGRSTASPDSAIHSCYSPTQSPIISRHRNSSGFSSPYASSLSRNNSDASQYGGSQNSSSYSYNYSSVSVSPIPFSPTDSPIQGRHPFNQEQTIYENQNIQNHHEEAPAGMGNILPDLGLQASSAVSRQQLINSPCPICGDKISGFHYGIFSCESCKGFFKRTVQNHKNYVCLRGSSCVVAINTRKKCPACRFNKCLNMGMKLEAIRVDRTRGGRSTYPFSYTLPNATTPSVSNVLQVEQSYGDHYRPPQHHSANNVFAPTSSASNVLPVPQLLQEIMEVEHLWQCAPKEKINSSGEVSNSPKTTPFKSNQLSMNIDNIADNKLYGIVKWCKSLPLFKNISLNDQISLLLNAWCDLMLFSYCYRSIPVPGHIKVSEGEPVSLEQAKKYGLAPWVERMLNFTDQLRRLKLDRYEYVALKVILLLSSDSSELKEPDKARASQEKVLQALQQYTLAHYPEMQSKFGEMLLRIPDLQRTRQVGTEMLSLHKEEKGAGFKILMELLTGDRCQGDQDVPEDT